MSVREAHGLNPLEINKYDSIDEVSFFSIASYRSANHKEPILAFEHKHEEIEFIIPITTINLFKHDYFKTMGECGYIYPVNSNVVHGFDHDLTRTSVCSITISKEFALERAEALGYDGIQLLNRFPITDIIYHLIKDFQKAAKSEYPNIILLEDLARQLTDILIDAGWRAGRSRVYPSRIYDPNIRKTLDYMFLNSRDQKLDLNNLASYCGYSPAYFSRVFKQYVGDSPITYLNRLRISEARSLMFNANLSLSDISQIVGFENLSTFTEAFKKCSGERPKAFRTRNLSSINGKKRKRK